MNGKHLTVREKEMKRNDKGTGVVSIGFGGRGVAKRYYQHCLWLIVSIRLTGGTELFSKELTRGQAFEFSILGLAGVGQKL